MSVSTLRRCDRCCVIIPPSVLYLKVNFRDSSMRDVRPFERTGLCGHCAGDFMKFMQEAR